MDDDFRIQAGRLASALKTVLATDIDGLPELPVAQRRNAPQAGSVAGQNIALRPPESPTASADDRNAPAQTVAPDDFLAKLPADMARLREIVADCRRCRLHQNRANTVFGEGPMNPILMIVGEGPGALEDKSGRPFCGDAGDLLSKIVGAMGLDRESQCYLTTIVKCRTADESPPTPDSVGLCRPFLTRQIELVRPRFLLVMGQTAATVLAGSPSISRLRGRFLMHDDIPMLVTYHPSTLLKEPGLKKLVWEDVKLIMARIKG